MSSDFSRYRDDAEIASARERLALTDPDAAEIIAQLLHERDRNQASRQHHIGKARRHKETLANGLADPEMPAQSLRLIMGEMSAQEIRTARAAIRYANAQVRLA